jgi:hypothetical protein
MNFYKLCNNRSWIPILRILFFCHDTYAQFTFINDLASTFGNLLDRSLAIQDKTDPNNIAAKNWIVGRNGENYSINTEGCELSHGYVT